MFQPHHRTTTTFARDSTSDSSVFDSFRYHSTTAMTHKQRFKRVAKPILHLPRTKPTRKPRLSKSKPKLTAPESNPSSEPHISFQKTETLPREFFEIDALDLAPRLLGKFLRRDDVVLQITEVEAYRSHDTASHARFGITPRTAPLFGPGGHAYVYLCYGLHVMLNVVADKEGAGGGVLIRSCAPVCGLEVIQHRRGQITDKPILLTGPGKVGQALGLSTEWSNHPLYTPECQCRWFRTLRWSRARKHIGRSACWYPVRTARACRRTVEICHCRFRLD
ncbi:DNA-3-methyladenine glycosylase isoform X2 [Vicia villosa]|uniref:DNA-3-methyladenine glycosylase isoform X2 n=1 Tax=Vicia villosa TaxID=3911 RepID=UPI00273B521B|nr:DNA-3-methyladenine glycosylase isoform X2 [Vicia villosa]